MRTTGNCQAIVRRTGKPCLRSSVKNTSYCGYHHAALSTEPTTSTDDEACSICLVRIIHANTDLLERTPCKHVFHKACLRRWKARRATCPLCRTALVRTPPTITTSRSNTTTTTTEDNESAVIILRRWEGLGWNLARIGGSHHYVATLVQAHSSAPVLTGILNTTTGLLMLV